MRLLAPIILLIMTAIAAYREGDDITGITNDRNSVASQPAALAVEASTETKESSGYGELVEAPGLLNRVTIFGY
jgi:parvulin-like peptidyl-prolyl isomerase